MIRLEEESQRQDMELPARNEAEAKEKDTHEQEAGTETEEESPKDMPQNRTEEGEGGTEVGADLQQKINETIRAMEEMMVGETEGEKTVEEGEEGPAEEQNRMEEGEEEILQEETTIDPQQELEEIMGDLEEEAAEGDGRRRRQEQELERSRIKTAENTDPYSDIPTPYMSVAPLTTAYTGRPQHDPASIAYGERAVQMVLQRRQEAEYAAHVSAAYPPQPCRAAALEGIMEHPGVGLPSAATLGAGGALSEHPGVSSSTILERLRQHMERLTSNYSLPTSGDPETTDVGYDLADSPVPLTREVFYPDYHDVVPADPDRRRSRLHWLETRTAVAEQNVTAQLTPDFAELGKALQNTLREAMATNTDTLQGCLQQFQTQMAHVATMPQRGESTADPVVEGTPLAALCRTRSPAAG
eukprot:gene5966-7171_t